MNRTLYQNGRRFVNAYAKTMLDFEVAYQAPLPQGAKLFVANHPTTIDPFLLTLISKKPISIMVHETLFKVPLFGRYLRAAGHIEVIMGSGIAALSAAMQLLEVGRSVAIFPEGALSPADGLAKAHSGAARLALATGAQVVPVGIGLEHERIRYIQTKVDGVTEVGRWFGDGAYRMTVGNPTVYSGNVNDWAYVDSITQQMMDSIIALMRESENRLPQQPTSKHEENRHGFGRAAYPA